MKNNKGFISMTLVYSFLTLFLFIMAGIMASQSEKFDFIDYINEKVSEDIENMKDKSSTLMQKLLDDNFVTDGTRFNLNAIANSNVGNGNGLYYIDDTNMTDENDDKNTSRIYFFRGTVPNNYVLIKKSSKAYCFKIIRTNEDGGIRMMFLGKGNASSNSCNNVKSGIDVGEVLNETSRYTTSFNDLDNDNAFVGYMMGKSETALGQAFAVRTGKTVTPAQRYLDTHYYFEGDLDSNATSDSGLKYFHVVNNAVEYHEKESTVKKIVDKWYEDNMLDMAFMITDAVYCADKSIKDSGQGFAQLSTTYFDNTSTTLTYKCPAEADRLSLSQYNGGSNGNYNSLRYPVGLPTSMDILYAGGQYNSSNANYYMKTDYKYWTMTPSRYSGSAYELIVDTDGKLIQEKVTTSDNMHVYPVLSIKADSIVTSGSGTSSSPYIIDVSTN